MDSAKVGIFEETDEISFRCFLECGDGGGLESQFGLVILSDLADQSLEGKLSDEELSALLISSDFSKGDGSGPESMRLLDASTLNRGGRFAGDLVGDLFAGSLSSGGFAGSLLCSGHFRWSC